MKSCLFCGFNGFHQFGTAHAMKVDELSELSSELLDCDSPKFASSWSFNIYAQGKQIVASGFVREIPGNQVTFTLPEGVKSVGATNNSCLVLLNDGKLFRINMKQCVLEELNFTSVERPPKRNIFGEEKAQESFDYINLLACGRYISVVITIKNNVFHVPTKIYEFPKHLKIKNLVCGFEHALALTSNGDVYSWGNGLRGQLGHPELKVQEIPLLVEALAGVKMVAISAGGWHSAAISSFGDLYLWGSNVNGQLGIAVYKSFTCSDGNTFQRKNPTVYALPEIFDGDQCCSDTEQNLALNACTVVEVACGARHTVFRNSCGRIYFAGWNEYNQFGKKNGTTNLDKFTEIKLCENLRNVKLYCGPWSTVLINETVG